MSTEKSVTRRLLNELAANGFKITRIDDGGDEDVHVVSVDDALDAIFAVEDSRVYFRKSPLGREYWVYVVLGNDPTGSEVISDNSYSDTDPDGIEFRNLVDSCTNNLS